MYAHACRNYKDMIEKQKYVRIFSVIWRFLKTINEHVTVNLEYREHLKYFGNVYSVMTNHIEDQDTRANHKTTN